MFEIVFKKNREMISCAVLNYNSFDINKVLEFGALLASGGQVILSFSCEYKISIYFNPNIKTEYLITFKK